LTVAEVDKRFERLQEAFWQLFCWLQQNPEGTCTLRAQSVALQGGEVNGRRAEGLAFDSELPKALRKAMKQFNAADESNAGELGSAR
jgi:hypothetical protein